MSCTPAPGARLAVAAAVAVAAGCSDPTIPIPDDAVPPIDRPVAEWQIEQPFGALNPGWGGYHLAVDIPGNGGVPVVAIADGVVRVALVGVDGYGGIVVTEHEVGDATPSGTLLALYGHVSTREGLQVRVGQSVVRGQQLAALAYDDEDGGAWPPHLHLGLRDGPHTGQAGLCGYWLYVGYTRSCEGVNHNDFLADGWIDPLEWFAR